jgi:hypothetical protein
MKKYILLIFLFACTKNTATIESTLPLYRTISSLQKINSIYSEFIPEKIECSQLIKQFDPISIDEDQIEKIRLATNIKLQPGILVDECEFSKVNLFLPDEVNRLNLENKSLKNLSSSQLALVKEYEIGYRDEVNKMEEVVRSRDTWFERYKITIGLISGIIIGAGATVLLVYGLNQVEE